MRLPAVFSTQQVRDICLELGLDDWTLLEVAEVSPREAEILRHAVGSEALEVSIGTFQKGLEVELEHGIRFPDANVTHNHPLATAAIVLAHLKEMLDYYERLEVAELEGDLAKAVVRGDPEKTRSVYGKLLKARCRLQELEAKRFSLDPVGV